MESHRLPRFVADRLGLEQVLRDAKLQVCRHCWRFGTLIGHGLVRGYAARSGARVLRGRRLLCSNRFRRSGCGRTVTVSLASHLVNRVADTESLVCARCPAPSGVPAASLGDAGSSRRRRSRLRRALRRVQSSLRSVLLPRTAPPGSQDPDIPSKTDGTSECT